RMVRRTPSRQPRPATLRRRTDSRTSESHHLRHSGRRSPGTMTDRRESDRRIEDMRLAEAVTRIEETIAAEMARAETIHAELKGHKHAEIERLIHVLEGQPRVMPSGQVKFVGGLISEVEALTKAMRNGGLKIKLPPAAWAAIVVAIITGIFNIGAALAGRVG